MRHLLNILAAVAVVAMAATGCGRKGNADDAAAPVEVEEQNSRLAEALNTGDIKHASAMADSMSLFVDDFTPEQTVQVLMAFIQVHNEATEHHERRRDLETLRKYIDVYDIALSVNPKDTRAAFEKAHRRNPEVDFDSIAKTFRERLAGYDAAQDGSLVAAEPEENDTVSADTLKEEIPVELRPAE